MNSEVVVQKDEDRNRAALISFIFHAIFFALLWFYKIGTTEIIPATPEIVIDLNGGGGDNAAQGEPDRGMNDAPAPKGEQLEDPTSKTALPEPPTPTPPAKSEPKPAKSEPTKTDLPKNTPTTDDPEVAAIKKQREETRKKQEAEDETRKNKQREEQAAADAKRRADQAAADLAAAEKAAYEKRKGKLGGALGKPGDTGTGAGGGGKPGNGGVANGTGDNPFGKSAGSGGGDGGGSGGGSGEGIGGGLKGRKVTSRPTADCPVKEKGVVVVKVTVDSQGNVTDASPTLSGSTLSDEQSKSCAVKTAKKFKFASSDASSQTGTIAVKFNFN
jgi:colicin import membrane protein